MHGICGPAGGIYSGLFWSALEIHSYFLTAMAFFKAFTQFFQEQSHRLFVPIDNGVVLGIKRSQDNYSRTFSTTTYDSTSSTKPHAIYDGGFENAKIQGVRLRIANGGAGQIGLIRAWADAFIQYMVSKGMPPFEVRPRYCAKT
jgi:hypothetical protein